MTQPSYWYDAKAHLIKADAVLAAIINRFPDESMKHSGSAFYTLVSSIVGQQISVKAASSIRQRLIDLVDGEVEPERILALDEEALRGCGLSGQKISYLRHIAEEFSKASSSTTSFSGLTREFILAGTIDSRVKSENNDSLLTPRHWPEMHDEQVITQLVALKGIGRWTAEMFLMFHLQRPDILPLGDLGLIKGIETAYGVTLFNAKKKLKPRVISRITKPWTPYRTVATWYLWRSLDPEPVTY